MTRLFYLLLLLLIAYPIDGRAQTGDFFSNTQGIDRLSTGSAGACPNCPGFNPDRLIRHSGTDPDGAGPITFSQTITTTAPSLGGTVSGPFFNLLGPGAVTDNLFGIISDPGADPAKCGVNTSTGVVPTSVGLNCGDLRFDPASQGMTLPASPAADILTSTLFSPSTFLGDFAPSTDDHTGLDLKNRFIWSRTTTTLTDGDLSVTCTTATFACIGSKQQQLQVTPLVGGAAGTLASPGSGEQNFNQTTDWTLTNSSGNIFTAPTINWTLQFNDPIRDNNNQTRLQTGAMSGSFTYQGADTSATTFPGVTVPFVRSSTELCRGVTGTAGTCINIP